MKPTYDASQASVWVYGRHVDNALMIEEWEFQQDLNKYF